MKLFISYARENYLDVKELYDYLRITDGVTDVFWDYKIHSGDVWEERLKTEILSSDILLFIASRHSKGSEMCKKEVDIFRPTKKRIIPVHLENVEYSNNLLLDEYHALPIDSDVGRLKPVYEWERKEKSFYQYRYRRQKMRLKLKPSIKRIELQKS